MAVLQVVRVAVFDVLEEVLQPLVSKREPGHGHDKARASYLGHEPASVT